MKNLLFFFISSVLLLSCSNNNEEDQKEELNVVEETFVDNTDRVEKDSVIIPEKLRKSRYFEENELKELKERIKEKFDQLLFYSIYDNHYYYYVVKGKYNGIENEGKTFTIGILDISFNEIVPVEYDKIYNIGTISEGTVVVEKNGLRGLYDLLGNKLIDTKYIALYPSGKENVLAQFKIENIYGWIDMDGQERIGKTISPYKELGKSPLESQLIKNWQFSNKTMNLLIDAKYFPPSGHIITPSYIYDLGFLPA